MAERAAKFEAESRRMNTEAERIGLEKTHVERDCTHLEVVYDTSSSMYQSTGRSFNLGRLFHTCTNIAAIFTDIFTNRNNVPLCF